MFRQNFLFGWLFIISTSLYAQTPKGLSLEEYQKAKAFSVKDLDNDTYIKFDNNAYVLDKAETEKPFFITGDDSLRKRIDLYNLVRRSDGSAVARVIYYTNEKGKRYVCCLPNLFADRPVWDRYFEDVHATDREEKNYALKLSYVLSKELSYQHYKAGLKGKEVDRSEAGTYGTDICFPGGEEVQMADGSVKALAQVKAGDAVVTVDPVTHRPAVVKVKGLVIHEAKDYAVTQLALFSATEVLLNGKREVQLASRTVEATPNHPVLTKNGQQKFGEVSVGEEVFCRDRKTGSLKTYRVWHITQGPNGVQKVYNLDTESGETFLINGVMVMQKGMR